VKPSRKCVEASPPPSQAGSYLLEVLIAILIFSFGVLGLVGLLGSSVRFTNDARYRSEAANIANGVIADMWTTSAANLDAYFAPNGTKLGPWETKAKALLPIAPGHPDPITVDLTPGITTESRTAVVTVFWQAPGEKDLHQHVMTAQIGRNRGTP